MSLRKLIGATLVSGALCLGLAACGGDAANAEECWAAAAISCGNL